MMLWAATASASASREEASHSWKQIWWAAACALSVLQHHNRFSVLNYRN